jgi:hypothetical protein
VAISPSMRVSSQPRRVNSCLAAFQLAGGNGHWAWALVWAVITGRFPAGDVAQLYLNRSQILLHKNSLYGFQGTLFWLARLSFPTTCSWSLT